MAFSFAQLFGLLPEAGAVVGEVGSVTGNPVLASIGALLENPAVLELEKAIAAAFTATSTPGASVVIEPKVGPATPESGK